MEPRLTSSPISHVNATTAHGAQYNRRDTAQLKVPLSAKLQTVTSVGEDIFLFLFTFVKLSERLGNNQRSESLTHVILYYSASGFLGAANTGFVLCFLFPLRPGVGGVCFGADS